MKYDRFNTNKMYTLLYILSKIRTFDYYNIHLC
ncbi:Uncharacterised protein [Empedobacter falsenii]|uniref:Uncharacterized protein n=1 Tax=Empedobacter falsenii TaxID=343874 RepID=A0A376G5G4_9FLAO|nr:Uncharacterised protein [Empedobacter falsenii]